MSETSDKGSHKEVAKEEEAVEIRQELSEIRREFKNICEEVQILQKEQKEMALQFQREMQNLVGLIQLAHTTSQSQHEKSVNNLSEK